MCSSLIIISHQYAHVIFEGKYATLLLTAKSCFIELCFLPPAEVVWPKIRPIQSVARRKQNYREEKKNPQKEK